MEDPLLGRLGAAIRARRERRGLSVTALATRSGLSSRFLTELQAGRANISVARLARLASELGTTASELLADSEDGDGADGPRVIALLGVRGAGKSTIGTELARHLGIEFAELDRLVEAEAGLSLSEIFAIHGEAYFREVEVAGLRRFLARGVDAVLATGGGIVENAAAWKLLDEHTVTVWLRASADAHWSRVVGQGDPRPMAGRPAAKSELRRLLARRAPLYRRARYHVDTSRLDVGGSVRFIAARTADRRGRRAERRRRR